MHEYNSQLETLHLKEYGRNVQKIAQYITNLQDEEKKSRMAQTLIGLMKQINPNGKDNQDYDQMLWDHLYFITDLQLDLKESPFPKPKTSVQEKPKRVAYSIGEVKFQHYGKNVELLIKKAIEMNDPIEKEIAVLNIARIMKRFYMTWNKESVENEVILKQIQQLSNNQLSFDLNKVNEENSLHIQRDARPVSSNGGGHSHSSNHRNGGHHNNGGRRRTNSGGNQNNNNRRRK